MRAAIAAQSAPGPLTAWSTTARTALDDLLRRRPYNAATDLIDASIAGGLGDKVAFPQPGRSLTYGELQARTCAFAVALYDLGQRPEVWLGLLLPETIDFPVAFRGGIRTGIGSCRSTRSSQRRNKPTFSTTAALRQS